MKIALDLIGRKVQPPIKNYRMKKTLLLICLTFFVSEIFSQSPPARLKYFGFAIVDCGLDDPNDIPVLTNYINEVDTFSNVAQMCAGNPTDTIITRVNLMNSLCVKPILSVSNIFIYLANTSGPSGSNYDLYPNYQTRWDSFKLANASVLNAAQIEVFYICDEPTWNGVTFTELSTISSTIKADFPTIPQMFVEAYTEVNNVQIPTTVDWVGFDHYGIYDVSTDANYLAWLDTLESKFSTPNQKIWLVFDDEWNSGFWPSGWQPDTVKHVVQNYYNLAIADTNVIGMAGFTWPGLSAGWLGARSMPQNVINKTVQIGQLIKANYNPCTVGIKNTEVPKNEFYVFPNPANDKLNFNRSQNKEQVHLIIYGAVGNTILQREINEELNAVSLRDISEGMYFYRLTDRNGNILQSGKFIKE